jgi:hypothetical protein
MSIVLNGTTGIDSTAIQEDASGNVGIGITPSYRLHSYTAVGAEVGAYLHNAGGSGIATGAVIRGGANNGASGRIASFVNYSGTEVAAIDGDGTIKSVSASAALGYGTGAGGTVTQATSRTTAVTINKPTGQITMFTAAGTATWQSFTVNNSLVSASDVVVLSLNNSTNFYSFTTRAQTGNFQVWFAAVSGTASDTPIINFAIIKGASA